MIKINLLPAPPRRVIPITLPALPWLGILFAFLFVVVLGGLGRDWYMKGQEATQLAAEKSQLETQLKSLEAVIAKGRAFRQKALDLEKRLAAIELISQNKARPVRLLDALADAIPGGLWLVGLDEKPDKDKGNLLRMTGAASSYTAVADFMSNLRRSEKFKDVDLLVSRQDLTKTPPLVNFEVICTFAPLDSAR